MRKYKKLLQYEMKIAWMKNALLITSASPRCKWRSGAKERENLPHKHRISTFLNDNNYKHEKWSVTNGRKISFDAFCIRKPILPRFASYFNIFANVSSHQQWVNEQS